MRRKKTIILILLVGLLCDCLAKQPKDKKPKEKYKMARYFLEHQDTGAPSTSCTFSSDDVLNAGTGAFTFSVWFKGTIIFQKLSGSAGWQYYSTTKRCTIMGSSKTYYLTGTTTTDDGEWHHLVITRDSSFLAKLYIDSSEEASEQLTSQDMDNSETFGAAGQPSAAFDEIRFYKGVALTAYQVSNLYCMGYGVRVKESGFGKITSNGFYASCDDGSGTTVSGRKITSGTWSAHNGSFTSGDVVWKEGGIPLNSQQLTSDYEEYTGYINATSKRIQFEFIGAEDFAIREFKIHEPTHISKR